MLSPSDRMYHWLSIRLKYGLHLKHYAYPLRLLSNLARAKYYAAANQDKFVLRGIDFAVTYNCNFHCEHCYADKLKNNSRPVMSVEDYGRVCKQAMELGCLCFSLQGGEVFIRKDWEKVIQAFQPDYNHILLTSNGSLITEERVQRLKDLGLDTIYFSVDSGIAEEHDRFRNHQGSFEKILRAYEYCVRHNLKVVFNTCITKESLYSEGLKKLLDFSFQNRILVETIFARCLGNFDGRREFMLNDEDVAYYYQLRKNYPFVVRDLDNNYGKWGCPAVKEVLYITAYGDVCPCPYSHIVLGNVNKEPLEAIRARGLASRWYNHYHSECLTAMDEEFMSIYYPLIEKNPLITLDELHGQDRAV
ncbi:MAG: radical SAM protein [Syntrophobacter sp.]